MSAADRFGELMQPKADITLNVRRVRLSIKSLANSIKLPGAKKGERVLGWSSGA